MPTRATTAGHVRYIDQALLYALLITHLVLFNPIASSNHQRHTHRRHTISSYYSICLVCHAYVTYNVVNVIPCRRHFKKCRRSGTILTTSVHTRDTPTGIRDIWNSKMISCIDDICSKNCGAFFVTTFVVNCEEKCRHRVSFLMTILLAFLCRHRAPFLMTFRAHFLMSSSRPIFDDLSRRPFAPTFSRRHRAHIFAPSPRPIFDDILRRTYRAAAVAVVRGYFVDMSFLIVRANWRFHIYNNSRQFALTRSAAAGGLCAALIAGVGHRGRRSTAA